MARNSTCLAWRTEGVEPITIQNASSWAADGCNLGFYCPNNNETALPEYCTPVPECLVVRLSSGMCNESMGVLEPQICPAGSYCPKPGNVKIICPKGNFCPLGSYEPTPCAWPALYCHGGSIKDTNVLFLAILIILDSMVLLSVGIQKLLQRRRARQGKTKSLRKEAKRWVLQKTHTYSKIGSPSLGSIQKERVHRGNPGSVTSFVGLDDPEAQIESGASSPRFQARINTVQRSRTGFDMYLSQDFNGRNVLDMNNEKNDPEITDLQLFVGSMSRCLGATNFGLSFEFENLSFQPPGNPKKILDKVSGCINAGSLWGVMGASGAGKSTFVNVLMGKTKHTGGTTKVNGVPGAISKYKKIIGYVPQDDIVLPELTVRENILHSARIRLPSSWTDREIQDHVDILISCLQLAHVKHSLVGSTAAPVISGGQRKRVSIGMELAAAPMALFLDEPTSGLDATSAASIMNTLKALSRMGITVVTIIHQPRQEIWESLDSLLLLGAGRLIYHGPGTDVVRYFQHECGFNFPPHGNPADAVMDIIAGQGHVYKKSGDTSIQSLIENWSHKEQISERGFRDSVTDLKDAQALQATIKSRGAPFYSQIYFCFCRSLVQQWRMRTSFFFELAVGGLAGSLIGLAYVSVNGDNFRGLFRGSYQMLSSAVEYSSVLQMSLLVGLAIGLAASSPGVKIFGEERLIYWREAASGHNRFAYYMGKVLSTIPRMFFANVHFTTLFMLLSTPKISWGAAFLANQLYFWCIYGLSSCVSMVVKREDGPLIATLTSLIVGVLNGMSPSLAKVEKWHMIWLWRTFPGTWLAEGYYDRNVSPLDYLYQTDVASKAVGVDLGKYSLDMLVLFLLGLLYRIVAFLGLRYLNRNRQK